VSVVGKQADDRMIARLTLPQTAAASVDWATITLEQVAALCDEEDTFFMPYIRGK